MNDQKNMYIFFYLIKNSTLQFSTVLLIFIPLKKPIG